LVKVSPEGASVLNKTPNKTEQMPPSAEKILSKVERKIKEKQNEILACAIEKSLPEIEEAKEKTLEEYRKEVSELLNAYFGYIENTKVDRFLDKYYSLLTDYIMLYYQAKDVLKRIRYYVGCYLEHNLKTCLQREMEPEAERYFQKLFEEYLVSEEDLQKFIKERIEPIREKKLKEFSQKVKQIVQKHYKEELEKEIRRELQKEDINPDTEFVKNFTRNLEAELLKTTENKPLYGSIKIATSAGIGILVAKIVQKVAAKGAVKVGEKVAVKLAEKLAVKIGSSLAGFGSGLAACAETGPLAPICGAVAGAIAWVASDYAINKADEYFHREVTKREIIQLLEQTKKKVLEELIKNFKNDLNAVEGAYTNLLKGKIKIKDLKGVCQEF
jgi:hypothetical protein